MALYNNGYRLGSTPFRSGLGALTTIYNGGGSLFRNAAPTGRMRASAMTFGEHSAFPNGNLHPGCWMLPQKAGGMSMRPLGEGTLAADLIPTRPMTIDMAGSGDLAATAALVISMACAMTGSGSLTATITGLLDMTCDLYGSGDLAAGMEGIAAMAVDMLGTGDLDAAIAAYGDMTIDIVVTGTGLSTANVGASVWNALAASFNDAGTMGEKLNDAGSASNPWTEVIESGYTAAEILRLIAAATQGNGTGLEGAAPIFKSIDGTKDRITATYSGGTRTVTDRDGS
ncbi:MAG: hypothetical protein KJZ98_17190 [Burkholderiaceae bacterium]|nr:hypothetical protein [Burkholderiaceae bacterium]